MAQSSLFILILLITANLSLCNLRFLKKKVFSNNYEGLSTGTCIKSGAYYFDEDESLKSECDSHCDCDGVRKCIDGLCTGKGRTFTSQACTKSEEYVPAQSTGSSCVDSCECPGYKACGVQKTCKGTRAYKKWTDCYKTVSSCSSPGKIRRYCLEDMNYDSRAQGLPQASIASVFLPPSDYEGEIKLSNGFSFLFHKDITCLDSTPFGRLMGEGVISELQVRPKNDIDYFFAYFNCEVKAFPFKFDTVSAVPDVKALTGSWRGDQAIKCLDLKDSANSWIVYFHEPNYKGPANYFDHHETHVHEFASFKVLQKNCLVVFLECDFKGEHKVICEGSELLSSDWEGKIKSGLAHRDKVVNLFNYPMYDDKLMSFQWKLGCYDDKSFNTENQLSTNNGAASDQNTVASNIS